MFVVFLASPVWRSTGRYNFRSTPERLQHLGRLSTGSCSGSCSGGVGSGGRGSGGCHSVVGGNAGVTATSFAATSLVALSTTTTATTNSSADRPNAAIANCYSSCANLSTHPNATGTNSSNANPSTTRPNATGTNPSNANPSATRPNGNRGRVQTAAGQGHEGRNHPP